MRLYTPGYGHLLALACLFFPLAYFSARRLIRFGLWQCEASRFPQHKGGSSGKVEDEEACERRKGRQLWISSEIAMRLVTFILAIYCSMMSFLVILETQHDVLYSKSPSLPPLVHIAIPYFLYDCYAMYATSAAEARAKDYSVRRWTNGFAKKQLPFFVHHILICILGYPIAVNPELVNNLGDFFIGCFCFGELSNIFICIAVSLKTLNMHKNCFFLVNGVALAVTFICSRILIIPYMYLKYFSQEQTGWAQSVQRIPVYCHCGMLLIVGFQSFWLYVLVVAAVRVVGTKKER